ncbi:HEPN domain-containing protein [Chitinophaga sancti]|uniref:HEPN domain-containing protein n=1 Tax=Chitinophaga sancti TaxID=1004 RepID=A0A1K1S890_9BACT|nr:HEPN domain-containing protein [Chitinophaga sancti]WQD60994.1 HEPN domain-containing protein [Chitinophaga sancti]WQG86879.1 HEPN domain-containing protein [Chitinophaga sancti]SFW80600.1 HEPN domain-containing protein [Chitinophaga sancti]
MNTPLNKRILSNWPVWHQQPFRLTCNEINNPHHILKEFFTWYTLSDIRLCLKEWLTDALRAEDVEALEYVTLHDNIEKLIEAAWVILGNESVEGIDTEDNNKTETPIIPLTPEVLQPEADPLERILDIIVKITEAEKIYLLDAHGTDKAGHAFQYDLLILLPVKSQQPHKELQEAIEAQCKDIADIMISFSKAVEIYRLIKEGHIFFSFVCIAENLIYDDGRFPLPVPAITDLAAIKTKALEDFNKPFHVAQIFYDGAGYFYLKHDKNLTAFMLQQATEHCLRAILYALTGHNYVTHNLQRLFRFTRQCAPELQVFFHSGAGGNKNLLHLLYKAYVHARYKDDFQIEHHQIQILFRLIKQLHDKTTQVFQEKLDSLTNKFTQHD